MPPYTEYTPWVSSEARTNAEADDGYFGAKLFKRPQVQTSKRSQSIQVGPKSNTPAAPQPSSKSGQSHYSDEIWVPLPLPEYRSIRFAPQEPPTHHKQSKLHKLRPRTETASSAAPPTKVVIKRRKSVKVAIRPPLFKKSSPLSDGTKGFRNRPRKASDRWPVPEWSAPFIEQSHKRGTLAPRALTGSRSNATRQLQHNSRPCSGSSRPNRRIDGNTSINRNTSVYRPSTAVTPVYSSSHWVPPLSPIPELTVMMPVGDSASSESPSTLASPSMPITRIRPLPPIPGPCAAPRRTFSPPPYCRRQRVLPVSMDDLDYREVITSFIENDNPAFRDCQGMMDWRTPYIAAPAR